MSDYINPPDIVDSLALGDPDDATLQLACSAITSYINNVCGRDFRSVASSVRYFDPTDCYVCPINDASTVSAVATDDGANGLYSTSWAAGDWQAQPVGGLAPSGSTGWPYRAIVAVDSRQFTTTSINRRPLVKVTAVWGWAAIPDDITLAALFLAEETFKAAKEAPFGSANMADFGPVQIRGNRRVDALLNPYKTMTASDGRFLVA